MQEEIFIFPLKQHLGVVCQALVTAGQSVVRGEKIAETENTVLGSVLYSSVNGIVTQVSADKITIATQTMPVKQDYLPLTGETPLELIRAAGIVGLGGAGFPTYQKLAKQIPGGTLLINAAECEPILGHNITRLLTNTAEILAGIELLLSITEAKTAVIAIKGKQRTALEKVRRINQHSQISLHELPDLYPMGEERAVVREVLQDLLPPDALPAEANSLVINLETVFRIYEAVVLKKPLLDKDLTLAGNLTPTSRLKVMLDVPLGKQVAEILKEQAPEAENFGEIILGGPFTGQRGLVTSPIEKTTGGIILTLPFPKERRALGLLVCACGATESRMRQMAKSMDSPVVGAVYCKQAIQMKNGSFKCSNPGECPGQAEKVLNLRKAGAEALLIGNCSDCSNTVMSIAPKMQLPVYHTTDFALRACGYPLVRKLKIKTSDESVAFSMKG